MAPHHPPGATGTSPPCTPPSGGLCPRSTRGGGLTTTPWEGALEGPRDRLQLRTRSFPDVGLSLSVPLPLGAPHGRPGGAGQPAPPATAPSPAGGTGGLTGPAPALHMRTPSSWVPSAGAQAEGAGGAVDSPCLVSRPQCQGVGGGSPLPRPTCYPPAPPPQAGALSPQGPVTLRHNARMAFSVYLLKTNICALRAAPAAGGRRRLGGEQ